MYGNGTHRFILKRCTLFHERKYSGNVDTSDGLKKVALSHWITCLGHFYTSSTLPRPGLRLANATCAVTSWARRITAKSRQQAWLAYCNVTRFCYPQYMAFRDEMNVIVQSVVLQLLVKRARG